MKQGVAGRERSAKHERPDAPVTQDTSRPRHYSYRLYADPTMADRFERVRFGGPIGSLVAETQDRVLADFSGDLAERAVLDVGTGSGRAALGLAGRGARVTAVDASAEMLASAREQSRTAALEIALARHDAHALGFASRSFDVVVSLRVLMHAPDWAQCLAELCRVSKHKVVVDYPALASVALIEAVWRRALAAGGARVEAYRVLSLGSVRRVFEAHGFRVTRIHRQFVLPIALHKRIGSRRVTRSIERVLATLGLLRLCGSPVTILGERCER